MSITGQLTENAANGSQSLTGRIQFASADRGRILKVWCIIMLPNGMYLIKYGGGNQWAINGDANNYYVADIQTTQSMESYTLDLLRDIPLRGLNATVWLGYGSDLTDMIVNQKFRMIQGPL